MEGRDGKDETDAARSAVAALRATRVDGVVLGCTEIPLLLGEDAEAEDLVSPLSLLAEAAVRFAIRGTAYRLTPEPFRARSGRRRPRGHLRADGAGRLT